MSKKVIVAMSGGVDSSVAAALLQQQGFEVEGMFMKNWSPETIQSLTDCPWEQDQADAAAVCEHLGIPFRSINFEREYKEKVVDYFLREYAAGRTPNPDIMCNKEIKFKAFLDEAEKMGADYIATGHYVQRVEENGTFYLKRGVDPGKDQSYFLWTLNQNQLSRSLFPVGALQKSEVRKLAQDFGLPTAEKKDSQGICFIGHIDLKKFLMEQIAAKEGIAYIVPAYKEGQSFSERLEGSIKIGKHQGSMFYTIGERAGGLIDNGIYRESHANQDVPTVYVLHKDSVGNNLYITDDHNDPHFYSREIILEEWQTAVSDFQFKAGLVFQVRYQQKAKAEIESLREENGRVIIATNQPVWAVAAGQSVVIYDQDKVVAGGVIIDSKIG